MNVINAFELINFLMYQVIMLNEILILYWHLDSLSTITLSVLESYETMTYFTYKSICLTSIIH
jgi:hypothetical protein